MTTPLFERFPYGTQITIADASDNVILSQSKGNFLPDTGSDGNLSFIGYSREIKTDDGLETVSDMNTLAEGYWQGPFGEEVYKVRMRLKNLTELEMEALIKIHKTQIKNKENVLLIDELIITEESLPRTRAKAGTINPTGSPIASFPSMVYFWGQYYVRIKARREDFTQQAQLENGTDLWMTKDVLEFTTLGKVPTTLDI